MDPFTFDPAWSWTIHCCSHYISFENYWNVNFKSFTNVHIEHLCDTSNATEVCFIIFTMV